MSAIAQEIIELLDSDYSEGELEEEEETELDEKEEEEEEEEQKPVFRGPPGHTPPASPMLIRHAPSLAKRRFQEVSGLKCPVCWEERGLTHRECTLFSCSHYVCRTCYDSLEGGPCPLCRDDISLEDSVVRRSKLF
jgi:hypothetical protein